MKRMIERNVYVMVTSLRGIKDNVLNKRQQPTKVWPKAGQDIEAIGCSFLQ